MKRELETDQPLRKKKRKSERLAMPKTLCKPGTFARALTGAVLLLAKHGRVGCPEGILE
jgi:hypothetical protein